MKPALGGYAVDALTEIKVEEFSFSLLHKEKLSPKMVKDILSVLRAVLNYTLKQNPSLRSIEVIYPKTEKKGNASALMGRAETFYRISF